MLCYAMARVLSQLLAALQSGPYRTTPGSCCCLLTPLVLLVASQSTHRRTIPQRAQAAATLLPHTDHAQSMDVRSMEWTAGGPWHAPVCVAVCNRYLAAPAHNTPNLERTFACACATSRTPTSTASAASRLAFLAAASSSFAFWMRCFSMVASWLALLSRIS